MSEARFLRAILDRANRLGLLAFHCYDSRHATGAGFPDLVLTGNGGTIYRELKTDTGRLHPEQLEWLRRLRSGGQDADVWRPAELNHRVLGEMLALR